MATTNIAELRDDLLEMLEEVKANETRIGSARAFCSVAGRIMQTCALQGRYAQLRNEKPDIAFMNVPKAKSKKSCASN